MISLAFIPHDDSLLGAAKFIQRFQFSNSAVYITVARTEDEMTAVKEQCKLWNILEC